MDRLVFIANGNSDLARNIQDLGCDVDTLLELAAGFFQVADQLGLSSEETAEFVYRMKIAFDRKNGGNACQDFTVYVNSYEDPSMLVVESTDGGLVVGFDRAGGGQFVCERCSVGVQSKAEAKQHVLSRHFK